MKMALKNIVPGERVTVTRSYMDVEWADAPGAPSWNFDLNERGILEFTWSNGEKEMKWSIDQEQPEGWPSQHPGVLNFWKCATKEYNVVFKGIKTDRWSFWEPGYGDCACGRKVILERDYGHGIDCECGRIYNQSGQELAPRSQWDDRYEDDDSMSYAERFGYAGDDY